MREMKPKVEDHSHSIMRKNSSCLHPNWKGLMINSRNHSWHHQHLTGFRSHSTDWELKEKPTFCSLCAKGSRQAPAFPRVQIRKFKILPCSWRAVGSQGTIKARLPTSDLTCSTRGWTSQEQRSWQPFLLRLKGPELTSVYWEAYGAFLIFSSFQFLCYSWLCLHIYLSLCLLFFITFFSYFIQITRFFFPLFYTFSNGLFF